MRKRFVILLMALAAICMAACTPPSDSSGGTTTTTAPSGSSSSTTTTTLPPATCAIPANEIINCDLRDGTPLPTGQNQGGWGTNTVQFVVSPDAPNPDGYRRSVQVTISNFVNGAHEWYADPVAVTPGNYTFSDWYRGTASQVYAQYYDATGNELQGVPLKDLGATATPTTWTQTDPIHFTVPSGVAKISILHVLFSNGQLNTSSFLLTRDATGTTTTTTTLPAGSTTTTTAPATTTTTTTVPTSGTGPFSKPVVTINFDDSWGTGYTNGLPVLQKYGYHATNMVICDTVQHNSSYTPVGSYMNLTQLNGWVAAGNEVGNHTVHHYDGGLPKEAPALQDSEIGQCQSYLTGVLGKAPTILATPECEHDANTIAVATKYGIPYIRNCDDDGVTPQGVNTAANWDPHNIRSFPVLNTTTVQDIKDLLTYTGQHKGYLNLMFHQFGTTIGTDPTDTVSVAQFDAILAAIKASGYTVELDSLAIAQENGTVPMT